MAWVRGRLNSFIGDDAGNSAIEYGVAAALIAVVVLNYLLDPNDSEGVMGKLIAMVNGIF